MPEDKSKWIFVFHCPSGHPEHRCVQIIVNETDAEKIAKNHGLAWPAAGATAGRAEMHVTYSKEGFASLCKELNI